MVVQCYAKLNKKRNLSKIRLNTTTRIEKNSKRKWPHSSHIAEGILARALVVKVLKLTIICHMICIQILLDISRM